MMPARLHLSPEDYRAHIQALGRVRAARLRARRKASRETGNVTSSMSSVTPETGNVTGNVSVPLSPLPPALPLEVPSPLVPPQTPLPSPLLPAPHSPPLPPSRPAPGRARDLIWDALAAIFGEPSTKSERAARNAAVDDFREGARHVGLTDAEQAQRILVAHENYEERMPPDTKETAFALARHLSDLVRPVAPRGPRVRQERVQRVTEYAAVRRERSFTALVDEHQRRDG